MNITYKYGRSKELLNLPDHTKELNIHDPKKNINKEAFINKLKKSILHSEKSLSNVGIVVSDKTRLCDYPLYLPWVTETIEGLGAEPEDITFYIAYGTHPRQSDEECLNTYGETYNKYLFTHHNSREHSAHTTLGITSYGTEARIRKDILRSSLIITFGAISHHYFAGFGGGRKLIFPGLGAQHAIYENHKLFLNFKKNKLHSACQPGNLYRNPLATDLKEIDAMLPGKISIHGILNSTGKVCALHVGRTYEDFEKACAIHNSHYRARESEVYDVVVASAGGYPKDINYIQSHKSIHNAAAFVKNKGHLILFAACNDGIGNDSFLEIFKMGDEAEIYNKLAKNYSGNGGTALATLAKTKRIHVHLVTSLAEEDCNLMGIHKTTVNEAREIISRNANKKIASIQNASMLIK